MAIGMLKFTLAIIIKVEKTLKDIAIVGAGSVGLLLGSFLAKAEYDVTIYTSTSLQAETIRSKGIVLHSSNKKDQFYVKAKKISGVENLNHDLIFIAVKQYHLETVIPIISAQKHIPNLVFLQNGMSHLRLLSELDSNVANILIGIVEHGALKSSPNEVHHTGIGELKIGYFRKDKDNFKEVCERITKVGFLANIYQNWFLVMEQKLIVNALINPLTTLYKVENGELLNNPFYFSNMQRLFEEVSRVIPTKPKDWERVVRVCQNTKANRSSMLMDIERSRPTEVNSILGYILSLANEQQYSLPLTQFLYESIKGMEYRNEGD